MAGGRPGSPTCLPPEVSRRSPATASRPHRRRQLRSPRAAPASPAFAAATIAMPCRGKPRPRRLRRPVRGMSCSPARRRRTKRRCLPLASTSSCSPARM
jgi:hypothetical protein